MTELSSKHVLLTGASRGVGPFIAEALAKRGAHVALTARSEKLLLSVSENLHGFKVKTLVASFDLTRQLERRELVHRVLNEFGRIDILINNAGLETEGPFLSLPWDSVRDTIELNLVAPMELTYLILPQMIKQQAGHIVNISSIGGKSGSPYDAAYCGTKAGLAEWTRGMRLEVEQAGVRFSTIFPGYVTEVGMFARFGITPPWIIGSCTPAQVAAAVVRAIERNEREIIVNSRPLRPAFALAALFPRAGDWLMHRLGVIEFQRKKVGA